MVGLILLKNLVFFAIGVFPAEMVQIESFPAGNPQEQDILYDFKNCAMVAAYHQQQDDSTSSSATINYFDYQNTPMAFVLPDKCLGLKPSLIGKKNHQEPKSLKYLLKPFN